MNRRDFPMQLSSASLTLLLSPTISIESFLVPKPSISERSTLRSFCSVVLSPEIDSEKIAEVFYCRSMEIYKHRMSLVRQLNRKARNYAGRSHYFHDLEYSAQREIISSWLSSLDPFRHLCTAAIWCVQISYYTGMYSERGEIEEIEFYKAPSSRVPDAEWRHMDWEFTYRSYSIDGNPP